MNEDLGHLLGIVLTFGLVLLFIYRRFRRNFGPQPLYRRRLKFRIWLLGIMGVLLLIPTLFSTQGLIATATGVGVGVALAIWAAEHTRFEKHDGRLFYIPHTNAGIVVTALFIGRILYRVAVISHDAYSMIGINAAFVSPGDFGGLTAIYHNPLTRCVFYILAGYYCYYYRYILHEAEHLKPEDWERPRPLPVESGNIR